MKITNLFQYQKALNFSPLIWSWLLLQLVLLKKIFGFLILKKTSGFSISFISLIFSCLLMNILSENKEGSKSWSWN